MSKKPQAGEPADRNIDMCLMLQLAVMNWLFNSPNSPVKRGIFLKLILDCVIIRLKACRRTHL